MSSWSADINRDLELEIVIGKSRKTIDKVISSSKLLANDGTELNLGQFDKKKTESNGLYKFAKAIEKNGLPKNDKSWRQLVNKQLTLYDNMKKLTDIHWRDLEVIGIELAGLPALYEAPWEFPNLTEHLQPGGELFARPYPLHLFLGAQPIYVDNQVLNVPYVVVIDCEVPPPNVLADHRLQQGKDVLTPFAQLSMSWAPYIPNSLSNVGPMDLPREGRINLLDWKRRPENFEPLFLLKQLKDLTQKYPETKDPDVLARADLILRSLPDAFKTAGAKYVACMRKMKDLDARGCKKAFGELEDQDEPFLEELHKWEYLVPYVVRPQLFPDAPAEVTAVNFQFTYKTKSGEDKEVDLDFDKEIDRLAMFVDDFKINYADADESLFANDGEQIKQAVRDAFKAERARQQSLHDDRQEKLAQYSADQLVALRNMKVYKFYPNHPTIDVTRFVATRVNIYIGDADSTVAPKSGYRIDPKTPQLSGRGRSKFATPRATPRGRSPTVARTPSASTASSTKNSTAKKRKRSKSQAPAASPTRTPRRRR